MQSYPCPLQLLPDDFVFNTSGCDARAGNTQSAATSPGTTEFLSTSHTSHASHERGAPLTADGAPLALDSPSIALIASLSSASLFSTPDSKASVWGSELHPVQPSNVSWGSTPAVLEATSPPTPTSQRVEQATPTYETPGAAYVPGSAQQQPHYALLQQPVPQPFVAGGWPAQPAFVVAAPQQQPATQAQLHLYAQLQQQHAHAQQLAALQQQQMYQQQVLLPRYAHTQPSHLQPALPPAAATFAVHEPSAHPPARAVDRDPAPAPVDHLQTVLPPAKSTLPGRLQQLHHLPLW
jgi:hypothetical protein